MGVMLIIPIVMLVNLYNLNHVDPLPDFSMEGISPKVSYFRYDAGSSEWIDVSKEDAEYSEHDLAISEEFFIDRNGDGLEDVIVYRYHIPQVTFKKRGKFVSEPEHDMVVVKVDDDLDGDLDRIVIDYEDEDGNLGMDGIFDRQHKL